MKNIVIIIVINFLLFSCNSVDFVYKNKTNLVNPLYEKTKVSISGPNLVFMNSYIPMLFGSNEKNEYYLEIEVKEKKTKRSVETNQATSNLRYELRFFYNLTLNNEDCVVYENEILSFFSIIPKSEGYNYGADVSLEKKYELAIRENLNQFISFLSIVDLNTCKNEARSS